MPEFAPGESKTARVPMKNPTEEAFDYTAELYMGVNLTLMSAVNFHLEAGESKDVDMLVTMPSEPGTYPVYIGVFSGGQFIEPLYQAAEDVVISGVPPNYYDIQGSVAMTYNDNGSFRCVSIAYFSKYGYKDIPILFKAFEGEDQRSLIHWEGMNYKVGDYGTQSVQKVLPDKHIGYWIFIWNLDAIANMSIRVYLQSPTGEWRHVRTLSSAYE